MAEPTKEQQQKEKNIAKAHYRQFNITNDNKNNSMPSYNLNSINFTNNKLRDSTQLTTTDYRETVPKLIVLEYQPDLVFNWNQKWKKFKNQWVGSGTTLMTVGGNIFDNIKDRLQRVTSSTAGTQKATKGAPKSTNSVQQLFLKGTETEYANQVLTSPIQLYKDFFDGKYVGQYELPLFENKYYMSAKGDVGWSISDELKSGLDVLNKIQASLNANLPLEIPMVPEWKNTNDDHINITTKFHLYNNNFENLVKNFYWINSIVAGAHWIQVDFKQFSPNVYTVIMPGIFKIIYAKMNIKIRQIGNRRRLSPELMIDFVKGSKVKITNDTMFPDVWEVNIDFTSLIPNNYNTMIDGLLNNDDKVTLGEARVAKSDDKLNQRAKASLEKSQNKP